MSYVSTRTYEEFLYHNAIAAVAPGITWPWKPRVVKLYKDYNFAEMEDRFTIEVFFANNYNWMYYFRMPVPFDVQLEPVDLILLLANQFKNHFRSWREIDPEPHIILGEN